MTSPQQSHITKTNDFFFTFISPVTTQPERKVDQYTLALINRVPLRHHDKFMSEIFMTFFSLH